jgi:hypothetical protein
MMLQDSLLIGGLGLAGLPLPGQSTGVFASLYTQAEYAGLLCTTAYMHIK